MSPVERFPRRAGVATVVAREALTPRLLRVTIQADDFGADWPIEQPGEILTLLFVPADEAIVLPEQGWRFPAGAPEQEWRNYTVRRHRPAEREIDIDVVLHEPRGPACMWAEASPVGAAVGFAGPRIDFAPVDDADWLLLCGDETALPSIAATLEAMPDHVPVTAVVEIHDAAEELTIALRERQTLRWVHRDGEQPGTGVRLVDTLRALDLPGGVGQAWGAGESKVARDLRGVLREDQGLPRTHARARGYWLRTGDWLDDEE